jgi:hypothetical protein
MYRPDGSARRWEVSGGGPIVTELGDRMEIEGASAVKTDGGWQIRVKTSELRLELDVTQNVPRWLAPKPPFPLRLESGAERFTWKMLCPLGEVSGWLEADHHREDINGRVYMDGHDGSIDIGKRLEWWKWSLTERGEDNIVVTSTKWRGQPLASALMKVTRQGLSVRETTQPLDGFDSDALCIEHPEPPIAGSFVKVEDNDLEAGLTRFRRWIGDLGGDPAILALMEGSRGM